MPRGRKRLAGGEGEHLGKAHDSGSAQAGSGSLGLEPGISPSPTWRCSHDQGLQVGTPPPPWGASTVPLTSGPALKGGGAGGRGLKAAGRVGPGMPFAREQGKGVAMRRAWPREPFEGAWLPPRSRPLPHRLTFASVDGSSARRRRCVPESGPSRGEGRPGRSGPAERRPCEEPDPAAALRSEREPRKPAPRTAHAPRPGGPALRGTWRRMRSSSPARLQRGYGSEDALKATK